MNDFVCKAERFVGNVEEENLKEEESSSSKTQMGKLNHGTDIDKICHRYPFWRQARRQAGCIKLRQFFEKCQH